MRFLRALLLMACAGTVSCQLGDEGPRRVLTGTIEFRSARTIQPIQGSYLAAIDSLHVDVESGGGSDRKFDGRKLLPMDTVVTASARALEGPVTVAARVLNARRDTLFAGTTTGTVTGDGFRLSLTLVPLRPVLAVSPAQLTLSRNSDDVPLIDRVTVYNRGASLIVWRARLTGCSPNECSATATFLPIPQDSSRVLLVQHIFQRAASGSLIISAQRDSLVIPYVVR